MKSENLFRVFPRLLVCVVALTAYCLCPQQASAADRVLCFGDSVTEGTYIDGRWNRGTSWVNVVDQLGADQIEAINDGVSGRRTGNRKDLTRALAANKDIDHVIFFLGVNDLCVATEDRLRGCVENTEWMIRQTREAYGDIPITIMSSPGLSIGNVAPKFHKMGYDEKEQAMLDRLRGKYRKLAAGNTCGFVDLWGVVSPENYSDGLHPNTAGQRQIAEAVWKNVFDVEPAAEVEKAITGPRKE